MTCGRQKIAHDRRPLVETVADIKIGASGKFNCGSIEGSFVSLIRATRALVGESLRSADATFGQHQFSPGDQSSSNLRKGVMRDKPEQITEIGKEISFRQRSRAARIKRQLVQIEAQKAKLQTEWNEANIRKSGLAASSRCAQAISNAPAAGLNTKRFPTSGRLEVVSEAPPFFGAACVVKVSR